MVKDLGVPLALACGPVADELARQVRRGPGSEISPMPWMLASLGATVKLIETDPQWVPIWEKLREQLKVDVTWDLVRSEAIPAPSGWADVVTSFSVIEHQPDKAAAGERGGARPQARRPVRGILRHL